MDNALSNLKKFYLLGLGLLLLISGTEVYSWYFAVHDWLALLSLRGLLAFVLFSGAVLTGILIVLFNWRAPAGLRSIAGWVPRAAWLRWLAVIGLTLVFAWIFLYSPWQVDFPNPWTKYLIALAFALWISLTMSGLQKGLGWREALLGLALFIYVGSVGDLRMLFLTAFASRLGILTGGGLVLGVIYLLYSSKTEFARARRLTWWNPFKRWHAFLLALSLLLPLILRFLVGPNLYWFNFNLRFAFLILLAWLVTFLLVSGSNRRISIQAVLVGLGLVVLLMALTNDLYQVSTYPFSLSWSEGNRFYDYSMVFGQGLYHAVLPIANPYTQDAPGRYLLWGFPFLLPSLPIWVHRLWGVVLMIIPPLVFGWFAGSQIKDNLTRLALAVWIGLLFIVVTPVYAPILLSAIVVILSAFDSSLLKRVIFVIVAAVYASLSRWTWFLAPAAWAALTDLLLYYPQRKSSFVQRVLPTVILVIAGLGAGYLFGKRNLNNFAASESLANAQPLLWYRLFPNQTYSLGIILGTVVVTGPMLVLLIWWMASRHWKLDALQILSVWVTLAGFLGAGLVVSTKIGGGGNLHNLDMYLITLTFVFALGISNFWKQGRLQLNSWPFWSQAVLCWALLLIVFPFTSFSEQGTPATLDLPPSLQVQQTLATLRVQVAQASQAGEVLFMDQRQLLTFGYVRDVPLIPDYEKKYMMDQAMGSSADFFRHYYQDLAGKRFVLIVSEPLKHILKGQDTEAFSAENDAWVKWVSDPTLCFYKPIFTDPNNKIMLLVPRPTVTGCEKYLSGG
jgi:hypothetical protein